MTHDEIRTAMLGVIKEFGDVFIRDLVLEKVYCLEQEGTNPKHVLAAWDELYRAGVISHGSGIRPRHPPEDRTYNNPDLAAREIAAQSQSRVHGLPWAHLTDFGKTVAAEISRDPVNQDGYREHLRRFLPDTSIAWGYVGEGLATFNHNCPTATAVLAGAAAEAMLLELRAGAVAKLKANRDATTAAKLEKPDKIKLVVDELTKIFEARIAKRTPIRERYEAYWSALTHRGRMLRNDAGHPTRLDPVSRDNARTALILFLDLAELVHDLTAWVSSDL